MCAKGKFRSPFFILLPIAFVAGVSALVMWLWNLILPDLFGFKMIGFWQALGILVLCRILFGSFRMGGKGRPPFASSEMKKKLMEMTPEEREKFKSEWKRRC